MTILACTTLRNSTRPHCWRSQAGCGRSTRAIVMHQTCAEHAGLCRLHVSRQQKSMQSAQQPKQYYVKHTGTLGTLGCS